jgi:hypothetical protein
LALQVLQCSIFGGIAALFGGDGRAAYGRA